MKRYSYKGKNPTGFFTNYITKITNKNKSKYVRLLRHYGRELGSKKRPNLIEMGIKEGGDFLTRSAKIKVNDATYGVSLTRESISPE